MASHDLQRAPTGHEGLQSCPDYPHPVPSEEVLECLLTVPMQQPYGCRRTKPHFTRGYQVAQTEGKGLYEPLLLISVELWRH